MEQLKQLQQLYQYFPSLSKKQTAQIAQLYDIYTEWNAKINVISRKDIDNLYTHHVLHSLGIAKLISFKEGSTVMDLGTGGGFPGIPLAILFPNVKFHLVDSIGKKLKVCQAAIDTLELENVTLRHCRAEEEKQKFDFGVSRAVMPLTDLVNIVKKNIAKQQYNALPNGLICLKGGELANEIKPFKNKAMATGLNEFFQEDFFSTKQIVYLPL